MTRFRRLALAAAALVVFALQLGQVAYAQSGQVVRQIQVQGNQRIEPSTVESYLTMRVGEPYDAQKIDESIKSLFATGLFDDVTIDPQGDVLVVKVVENPIINRIAFEGNKRLETKVLEAEIQLRPRVVYTRARVQNAVNRILELYRRNGRYAAKVEPKIIELDQNRVDLVFEISEGPTTGVGGINFIGNEQYSDSTLRGVIQTRESAWYRFLSSDDTYDPDRVSFDEELLRRFYGARGYADFQVVSTVAELTPDGKEFFITFTVEEGPQYKFGDINVETTLKDLNTEQLIALAQSLKGDTYNANLIEATVQAFTDEIGRLGYAFVNIEPRLKKNPDTLTVDVTYQINEGRKVYVERIDISGNLRTLDEVIRREFRLAEGDAFNTALLRRSQQRLRNLGFFEKVDVTTEQGSTPDKVVIKTKVTEKSTGELSFGAGFSTQDGVLGDVRLTEHNLLGRGQDLSANLTVSQRRQSVDISFTEPYFLDRDLAAGFDLFRTRTDFQNQSSYDETSTGGTLRLGYPLTENLRHSVRYTLRADEIQNVDSEASIFIREEEGERSTSLVGQTFSYDRRDVRFLPTEGYYLRLDQDIAGLGGDNRFIRHEVRGEYYYSVVPDVVLSVTGSGGYIKAFGGETVHLSNRFFIGGNNLRGFAYGGVGPRDTETDDRLGGNLYYIGSAEVRFPLGLPEELRIFGRAFVDAGSLRDIDVSGPTLDESDGLRVGSGVGLSWLSPLGPLSVNFALPVKKEDKDNTEFFMLSFGTRF
ncbi:MAG: outer membrane protein assembly factor BamA [Geminicoccaceae bacterium]